MQFIGTGLCILGILGLFIGGIMLLIAAFQESILWGLGTLIVPFVGLIFICLHWDVSKRPVVVKLAGLVVLGMGMALIMMFGEKGP